MYMDMDIYTIHTLYNEHVCVNIYIIISNLANYYVYLQVTLVKESNNFLVEEGVPSSSSFSPHHLHLLLVYLLF